MFYHRVVDEEKKEFCRDDDWFESYGSESFCISDLQTSDTLVLHPDDRSTDFLQAIYAGKGWDVLNDPFVNCDAVEELLETHDRIVCLGHGSPAGLFGGGGFLIHDGLTHLLRKKIMVSIWCYADQFMNRHNLSGFYSGMFISELGEALLCGIDNTDAQAVSASNDLFASVLGRYIDSENILENVRREYSPAGDPVIRFNRERLYSSIERSLTR